MLVFDIIENLIFFFGKLCYEISWYCNFFMNFEYVYIKKKVLNLLVFLFEIR